MRHWVMSVMTALLVCFSATISAAEPVEGQDYVVLTPARPTSDPSRIVVTEFFSYQCPHCFAFSPLVNSWSAKQPKDVLFERVPVSFGRSNWAAIGQTFYALQALGKVEQLDSAIFNAIHVQNIRLNDEAGITNWISQQGITAQEFSAAYNSFSVKSNMSRAEQLVRNYQVQGVPYLVVDGKYGVTSTKGHEAQLAVVEQLVARIRAQKNHK